MAQNESFFTRLTRLFRSGPSIRRKIKGYDYNSFYDKRVVQNNLGYNGPLPFKREASQFSVLGAYGILDRMARYAEFSEMEYTPIISKAMDIYADEAFSGDENGQCFHISSDNHEIKAKLEELFYDTINIEFNGRTWVRNLPVSWNTPVPLLSGEVLTIKEISDRVKQGVPTWVYSIQDKTHNIVPGKVVWCDITRPSASMVRIVLDDNTYVECTPDHEWILRDGTKKPAAELIPGTSLMPFYRNISSKKTNKDSLEGYERTYNPGTNIFEYTHKLVANDYCVEKGSVTVGQRVIHHIDFKKGNNEPTNLQEIPIGFVAHTTKTILTPSWAKASSHSLAASPSNQLTNHKVVSVTFLGENEQSDAYCMEVVGTDGSHDRHNFMVLGQNIIDNQPSLNSGICSQNCKYGDFFLYNEVAPDIGVINVQPIAVNELEREEGFDPEDPYAVRFKWLTRGQKYLENWQVTHMRILGNDLFLPYGTCHARTTRILTEDGVKEIQDIRKGDKVVSYDTKTQTKVTSMVLDTVSSGIKPCFEIKTRHNFLRTSKEHRILTINKETKKFEYKNVMELSRGDLLVTSKQHHLHHSNKIPMVRELSWAGKNYNGWKNNLVQNIPEIVTPEFSRLFGFLVSDGWLGSSASNTVSFAAGVDQEQNNYYRDLLEKFSGKKARSVNSDHTVLVNSKLLKSIFVNMGFVDKASTKRIPSWVFSAEVDIQKAFLDGLIDADGSTHTDKWGCVRYCIELSNEELVKDIKTLVQTIGYKSGQLCKRDRSGKEIFIEGRKIKNILPSFYFCFFKSELEQVKKYKLFLGNKRLSNDFVLESIESIEPIGEHQTYDIYVENSNHNFFANGIVTHNSLLESGRRIWRQYVMMVDAMLVYRLVRCLHGDSRIWTESGYKHIRDIRTGDKVYSYNEKNGELVQATVTDWVDNGSQEIWVVSSKHRQLKANSTHPIFVFDKITGKSDYVPVNELVVGQHQFVMPTKSISEQTQLPIKLAEERYTWHGKLTITGIESFHKMTYDKPKSYYERKLASTLSYPVNRIHQFLYAQNSTKGIPFDIARAVCAKFNIPETELIRFPKGMYHLERLNLPKFVDTEFARFFGFMVGDGFLTKNLWRLGFATGTDGDINTYYTNILKKYCSDAVFRPDKRSKHPQVGRMEVCSSYFSHLMTDLGFTSNTHTKKVPDWVFTSSDEIKEAFIEGLADADGHRRTQRCTPSIELGLCNKQILEGVKELCHQLGWNVSNKISQRTRKSRIIAGSLTATDPTTNFELYLAKVKTGAQEDILSVTKTSEFTNVYDIRVDNKYHNFIADGVVVHNSPERRIFYIDVGTIGANDVPTYMESVKASLRSQTAVDRATGRLDYRYNPVAVDEDYFIPMRGPNTATKIDTLPGGQHVTATEDVELIQSQLFAALGVPKAYLGYDEALSSKATLAQEDVRFSRSINIIQKIVVAELNKLAILHLYACGFDGEDLIDFELKLSNPSTVALQQKLDIWATKFDIVSTIIGLDERPVDMEWIQKNILEFNDDTIKRIQYGLKEDKKFKATIEAITEPDKEYDDSVDPFDPSNYELPGGNPVLPDRDEGEGTHSKLSTWAGAPPSDDVIKNSVGDGAPIKASAEASRNKKNRQRRKSDIAVIANTPDFSKMLGKKNHSLKDIFDSEFLRNPFRESIEKDILKRGSVNLSKELKSMIENFDGATAPVHPTLDIDLLRESEANESEIVELKDSESGSSGNISEADLLELGVDLKEPK